jgi:hypothetical protein
MKKMRVTSALLEDLWSDDPTPAQAQAQAQAQVQVQAQVQAPVSARVATQDAPCAEAARLRRELARLVALHLSSRLARAERRLMALRYTAEPHRPWW